MSNDFNVGGNGSYSGFEDLLKFYNDRRKHCPKGVTLKLQSNKYLLLQFVHPDTGKRNPKPCNVQFTEAGIIQAIEKAWKVKEALGRFTVASEFWQWYDKEILEVNEIKNDLKTYREIFEEIEKEYWSSTNKQTKRKRSKDIPNDVYTYNRYYQCVFDKFPKWDKSIEWEDIKQALFSWKQGTKSFKDAYFICKKIASKAHNSEQLIKHLADINYRQTDYIEKQSIDLETFLKWHHKTYENIPYLHNNHQSVAKGWLWVTSMLALYGLRPTEIAAALNLDKPYTKDGVTIPAINDPTNKTLLLVLGDFTYFGTSIKTGSRICKPVTTNKTLLEQLHIHEVRLPKFKLETRTKQNICSKFNTNHRSWLKYHNSPVTQVYAFRHLYNQLGEQYGIPQEIRARSMGHSVSVNDSVYKKRSNLKTTVDMLTSHSKQPLSLDAAKDELERNGFDLEDKSVIATLQVIYQIK